MNKTKSAVISWPLEGFLKEKTKLKERGTNNIVLGPSVRQSD